MSASSSLSSTGANVPSKASSRTVRVAIIGSGLTGLSAAYHLATASQAGLEIEVHLFERAPKIGLDSNSIDVGGKGGTVHKGKVRVDVPMRSINAGYYPNVVALYKKLGVPLRRSDFTYSFANIAHEPQQSSSSSTTAGGHRAPSPWFLYEGASGFRGFGIPSALNPRGQRKRRNNAVDGSDSSRREPRSSFVETMLILRTYLVQITTFVLGYIYLLTVSLYHHHLGHTRDPRHDVNRQTFQQYFGLKQAPHTNSLTRLTTTFLQQVVVPLFSAMMTAQGDSVLHAPVAEVMDYVALTFGRSHFTVAAGVLEVEQRISQPLQPEQIHTNCLVKRLQRTGDSISIEVEEEGADLTYNKFDHIVLATQANQSAEFVETLLGDQNHGASPQLSRMAQQLRSFTYEDSQVITHTDRRLLPHSPSDWRDLNLISPPSTSTNEASCRSYTSSVQSGSGSGSGTSSGRSSPQSVEALLVRGEGLTRTHSNASLWDSKSTLAANTHTMASHRLRYPIATADKEEEEEESVLIQTTNPLSTLLPRPDTVLSVSNFERAVLTLAGKEAQRGLFDWRPQRRRGSTFGGGSGGHHRHRLLARLLPKERWQLQVGALQGASGVWVCGSWSTGIPLLEACVTSSTLVVDELLRRESSHDTQ